MSSLTGHSVKQQPAVLSDAINLKFFPSLNGLRAVSIILVILSHIKLSGRPIYNMICNGALGVNVFFVISGFLITTLCLKEHGQTGRLSLRDFYIRRFLRIFPVAYLYLLVVVICSYFFGLHVPGFQIGGAALYIMNFPYFKEHHFTWLTAHYWSLSVEEQFYLIFPFILSRSKKVFTWAITFVVAILPVLCILQGSYEGLNTPVLFYFARYFIQFQSIAVGCMFSLLAFGGYLDSKWLKLLKIPGNIIAVALIFYLRADDSYSTRAVYMNLIIAMLIGYVIISNIIPGRDFIFRILNFKIVAFIGILSYSIYIWQQLFTFKASALPYHMVNYPVNMICLFATACVSYFLYEKYFLGLKKKFSKVKVSPEAEGQ